MANAVTKPAEETAMPKWYAAVFGLFLGLCVLKFGNPVILDHKILTPQTASDFWNAPWPTHWSIYGMVPLLLIGGFLAVQQRIGRLAWFFWVLPLGWFGWQLLSATSSVDNDLTTATLWQFLGCIGGYFVGLTLFRRKEMLNWLLIGVFAASAYCLVRAVEQHAYEFPLNYQALVEGERCGWTNTPPDLIIEMKQEGIILNTNGVDVANPVILAKFAKGRASGTLVYPNALAGLILLVFPVALTLTIIHARRLRPVIRALAVGMVCGLSALAFFWTGSKLGWLLAIILVGIYLFSLSWSTRLKIVAIGIALVIGLGVFGIRFHAYFAKGATSASARFDYWRAAAQTAEAHPLFGTGPGTFQHPYQMIKSPEAEMARLAHNDYLEQFSDSGIIGGIFYCGWIGIAFWWLGRKVWVAKDPIWFAVFAGLLAWFMQGLGEFSLFIPALGWVAFTLLGTIIGQIRFNSTEKDP